MRDIDCFNENLQLCFVSTDGGRGNIYLLWFTHHDVKEIWGDDFDDSPWWCNAGSPYDPDEEMVVLPVYFGSGDYADYGSHRCAVTAFNKGVYPWLVCGKCELYAGTRLGEVRVAVEELGGCIYLPHTQTGPDGMETRWYF